MRKRIGDTQDELADRLGAHQSDVSKWERADSGRRIPAHHLKKLCREAGVPLREFFAEPDESVDAERGEMLVAAEWMEQMADELRGRANLPPESRSDPERIADVASRAMKKRREGRADEEPGGA